VTTITGIADIRRNHHTSSSVSSRDFSPINRSAVPALSGHHAASAPS
jgi:hypothetical protein